jgi:hypothetical protein
MNGVAGAARPRRAAVATVPGLAPTDTGASTVTIAV